MPFLARSAWTSIARPILSVVKSEISSCITFGAGALTVCPFLFAGRATETITTIIRIKTIAVIPAIIP